MTSFKASKAAPQSKISQFSPTSARQSQAKEKTAAFKAANKHKKQIEKKTRNTLMPNKLQFTTGDINQTMTSAGTASRRL